MKARLKEIPSEWRKSTLFSVLGVALVSSLLRWRKVLPLATWAGLLLVLAVVAACACFRPRWFRGYYRFSTRVGFAMSLVVVRVALAVLFVILITPLGCLARLLGKDPLRLKRATTQDSYWQAARENSPLDRLF